MISEEKLKRSFMRVNCPREECEGQTVVFTHAKNDVFCSADDCSELIVTPSGGKAEVVGEFAGYVSE